MVFTIGVHNAFTSNCCDDAFETLKSISIRVRPHDIQHLRCKFNLNYYEQTVGELSTVALQCPLVGNRDEQTAVFGRNHKITRVQEATKTDLINWVRV